MHDANGTPKGPRAANGMNGAAKMPLNGHAVGPRTRPRPRGPGMLARTFNIAARYVDPGLTDPDRLVLILAGC